MQQSLAISWDFARDDFTVQVSAIEKPYICRGALSTINIYDFAAPVSIQDRALLIELTTENCEWDDPLPETRLWMQMVKSELEFVFGKAKLAPQPGVTIPAVLAVEIADMLAEEMDVQFQSVRFFTDSKSYLATYCNVVGAGEGNGLLSVVVAPVSSKDTACNMRDFRTYFYSVAVLDQF